MQRLRKDNINSPERSDRRFKRDDFADVGRYRALAKYFKGGLLVDLGCGNNPILNELKETYPHSEIVGVDFAPDSIAWLAERYPAVDYICEDVMGVLFENVDYIIAGEILEHLDDPQLFINRCLSMLKPGGWLAISTPIGEGDKFWLDRDEHMWSFTEEDIITFIPNVVLEWYEPRVIMGWTQKI